MTNELNFPVVTLIGSTRFRDLFERIGAVLSLDGYVVLMPAIWEKTYGITVTDEQDNMLERMGYWRMSHSDYVVVINEGDYIGKSTGKELIWALAHGIPTCFLKPISITELAKFDASIAAPDQRLLDPVNAVNDVLAVVASGSIRSKKCMELRDKVVAAAEGGVPDGKIC